MLVFVVMLTLLSCSETSEKEEPEQTTTTTTQLTKKDPEVKPVERTINVHKKLKSEVFEASNGLSLPYRYYLPADYSEEYAYPVVLFLHGAGERGTDNQKQLNNVVQKLYDDPESPFYQCILICPQCPENQQWVDTPWANGNYKVSKVKQSNELEATVELLDALLEKYSINPDRQYVMGISMGGFGTWDLIMRYPERFAAAFPICGGADPSKAASLVNLPITTFHDSTDPTVPVSGTRDMVQAIKDAGGTLINYTEPAQYGHLVWDAAVQTPGVLEWLFEQRK